MIINRTVMLIILLFIGFTMCVHAKPLHLTEVEKEWIKTHPTIRVANEIDWAPFDFNEDGVPKGLAIDHIKLLADKAGLHIYFINGHSWGELNKMFRDHQIDVMPAYYQNDERYEFTLYTKPYHKGKMAVFVNAGIENSGKNLVNKRVGMETAHGGIPLVEKQFPGIKITQVDFKNDLVTMLATNELDAIIGNPFVFYYYAKENQINTLRLSHYIPLSKSEQNNTSLHIGVRKDWPMLHQILSKSMNSVTDAELNEIKKRWADVTIMKEFDWTHIIHGASVAALVLIFLLWHNRRLHRMVKSKTDELKQLNEKLELKVIERTKTLTEVNEQLNRSIEEINTLRGIIPICASCKKIRDDKGYWGQIESYITKHSLAEFSHSVCPDCVTKLYPEYADDIKEEEP